MRAALVLCVAVALLALPTVAGAGTLVETFDGSSNIGGWTFGTGNETIEASGGNPGAYLHDNFVDTYAPQPHTSQPSPFTGDYRTRNVTQLGVDLVTFSVDFSADGRPLTLMLVSDLGTPADPNDDWAAYVMGPTNVPLPGAGWSTYAFAVPSQEVTLPAGWATLAFGPNSPPSPDWNQLMGNVSEVRFFYGDPTLFFIFQAWNLGLDNPTITADQVPVELRSFRVE